MVIDANRLRVGEDFTFNGSAETEAASSSTAAAGTDNLTGGAKTTSSFRLPGPVGLDDVVVGGGGIDQLALRGDYNVTFGANQWSASSRSLWSRLRHRSAISATATITI